MTVFRLKPALVGIVLATSILSVTATASASPWTVPNDEFVMGIDYNLQVAEREWIPDGDLQPFPLDGYFRSSTLRLDGRYGFTENFEGAFRLNFKQVTYESTPAILDPDRIDEGDLEATNDAILDFANTQAGAGDFFFYGRYNFLRGNLVITTESELKLPTGYPAPQGTFEDADPTTTIEDDVTLGDGQTDFTQSLLIGAFISPTRTFVRLDMGFKVRFGPPGHQAVGLLSVGQFIGEHVLLFAGANSAITVIDGQPIGTSFVTTSPEQPPGEFSIEQRDITLDKDWIKLEGGAIFTVQDIELRAAYSQILWGQNIPKIHSFSLGMVYAIPNLTGEGKATQDGS